MFWWKGFPSTLQGQPPQRAVRVRVSPPKACRRGKALLGEEKTFSSGHAEPEKGKSQGDTLLTPCLQFLGSPEPSSEWSHLGIPFQKRVMANGCLQMLLTAVPLSPELRHTRGTARTYVFFIGSYSLRCDFRMRKGKGSRGVGQLCKRSNQCYRPTTVFQASRSEKRSDCWKVLSSGMVESSLSCVSGTAWHQDGAGICSQNKDRPCETRSAVLLLSLPCPRRW